MTCNVGGIERVARILLGMVLLAIAFSHVFTGPLAVLAYVVGGTAAATGLVGYCPAWAIFGIDTCGMEHAKPAGPGH